MKRLAIALIALLAAAPQAQQAVPEIPFDSVPNFLKLPPDMNLGEASGVANSTRRRAPDFRVRTSIRITPTVAPRFI